MDGALSGDGAGGDRTGRAGPRVCLVTHPAEGAEDFARRLVGERVAACVNLLPVRSVYRWEGRVQEEEERLLVLKTTADRLEALGRFLERAHPYDVPELIALDPAEVEPAYLSWMVAETRPERPGR